jgi:hypothetical protein
MRSKGHIACMGVIKNACHVCFRKPAEERPVERCRLKSMNIKGVLKKSDKRAWAEIVWLRISIRRKLL